jgi:DNA-binding IclR family transcriptional regulator
MKHMPTKTKSAVTWPLHAPLHQLKQDRRYATTLVAGLDLLRCFSQAEPVLGNAELAERLGLPKSTVSRLAFTLAAFGFLRRNERLRKYELGPSVLTLAYPVLANMRERFVARRHMRELTDHTGGQTSMAILQGLEAVYVESFRPEEDWINRPEIGTTRPIMHTAIGHTLLHACALEQRNAVFAMHRERSPDTWRKDEAVVRRSLREITERGFCAIWGTYRRELWAIGVPMRNLRGREPIAFNLSVLAYKTSKKAMLEDFGPRLVGLVRSVEAALGL